MKLDEAIEKAREKLQNPAAKAAVQGEMDYLGVLTEDEMKRRANPGNVANGNRSLEGKAAVAFRLYVSAVRDRTKATPEEAFEAAKVIVFEGFQGHRDNQAGFAHCLRDILDRKVEVSRS
jgi:phosphoribosylanthranilate isomerase